MEEIVPAAVTHAKDIASRHPNDLVAVYHMDETLIWTSPAALEVLGYTPEESVGHHWRDFVAPEDHDHADLAGSDALLNGRSIEFGIRAITKSGGRVALRGTAWITMDAATNTGYLTFHAAPKDH